MNDGPLIPFWPPAASTSAAAVDKLFLTLLAIAGLVALAICCLILFFSVYYRADRPGGARGGPSPSNALWLEITWTSATLMIFVWIFIWSAELFRAMRVPPRGALELFVVGRQWMWKIQHQNGRREINELHVPLGRPVRLTMTSEDVIHSFFIPAFRLKQDVVPGRYVTEWFEATKKGVYHLYCAQYCGTNHAGMIGRVVVMEQGDYARWLAHGSAPAVAPFDSGRATFAKLGCGACHLPSGFGKGPSLAGIAGRRVELSTGKIVTADETYLREHILYPGRVVVAGYRGDVMPSFKDQLTEQDVMNLIFYLESLKPEP